MSTTVSQEKKRKSDRGGRFNSMLFHLVRHGKVSRLKSLIESYYESESKIPLRSPSTSHPHNEAAFESRPVSVLSSLTNHRGRNLLHVAVKSARKRMILYLVELGFPTRELDAYGNSAALLLLKSFSREKWKKRKRYSVGRYVECCKMLQLLLADNPELMTTANKSGVKPTDILQQLWAESSEEDRACGDEILMDVLSRGHFGVQDLSGEINFSPSSDPFSNTYDDRCTEDNAYSWEDYFSGFSTNEYRSHLDTIPEELMCRRNALYRRSGYCTATKPPEPSMDEQRHRFHARHNAALAEKRNKRVEVINESIGIEQYRCSWNEFAAATTAICASGDILWPPFCNRIQSNDLHSSAKLRIEAVLTFVNYSAPALRQLQIDWHPDRFAARFSCRMSPALKEQAMPKVIAISQLLNTATDVLRSRNDCHTATQ